MRSLSLKAKLIFITIATTWIALFICAGSLALYDRISFGGQLKRQLQTQARVVGSNCSAALAFRDPKTASEVISAFSANPRIEAAGVYDIDGSQFAEYVRPNTHFQLPKVLRSNLNSDSFRAIEPIENKGEHLGTIVLQGSDRELVERNARYLLVVGLMTLIATAVSIAVALRLQRLIYGPISRLCSGMDAIAGDKNYSLRIEREASDEIGHLVGTFNGMLAEIESRDKYLEQKVEERTKELSKEILSRILTEQELSLALDQAKAASVSKSEFLANISHELRTPMNGVLGMTELLLETPLETIQEEFAVTIKRSAEGLLSIISDVLDFSLSESGNLELATEDFSLNELVAELGQRYCQLAAEKSLAFYLWTSPNLPDAVKGDRRRVKQVLANLLDNSIKFTEHGEVELEVTTNSEFDDSTVVFTVRDTGIGISEEQQHRIFDSFTQGDGSLTRLRGGTGLGLTISKRLIELMDGNISIFSTLGQGSSFAVQIPLATFSKTNTNLGLGGWRVLLGLSQSFLSSRLTDSLGALGAEIEVVGDRLELIKRVSKASNRDLIVTDTGFLADRLLELINLQPVSGKLLLLADRSEIDTAKPVKFPSVSAVLTTPFTSVSLFAALGELVGGPSNQLGQKPYHATPNLLVVEDNPVNSKVAIQMLKNLGCTVSHAVNGLEAIHQVGEQKFDLVLMDIQMPELNGLEATERIRKSEDPDVRNLTIVAVTANAMSGDRELCLSAGMNDYFTKPISRQILSEILDKWIPRSDGLLAA